MAAQGNSQHNRGSSDISQHVKSWVGFTIFVKWSIVFVALIMIALAIFRTHG